MAARIVFALACAVALLARVELLVHERSTDVLQKFFDQTVLVEGRVADDPDLRATSLRVTVDASAINGRHAGGRLIASLPRTAQLQYGDQVAVRGVLQAPQPFDTDTGRTFDYPGYLAVRGVSALMPRAALQQSAPGAWSVYRALFALKHVFEASIGRVLPEPDASLLLGIVLGERRGLPDALTQAFIAASLIHVVVLSGYNISIVAEAVLRAGGFLPRAARYGVGAALMILFIIMTGGGSTSLRAGLMALIAILARYLRRPTLALRSLGAAGLALALWNPLVVLFDPSFILSMLATFGLITLSPWVESRLAAVPRWQHFDARSIAASTIAVQIFILPALLYFTGVLSFLALPANIVVLPVIPFGMLMGFLAGVLGLIHPVLGLVPALVCDAVLKWMLLVASSVAALPWGSTVVPAFPAWAAVVAYVPLSVVAWRAYRATSAMRQSASRTLPS